MARPIQTETFSPSDSSTTLWTYCGLDCCLTREIYSAIAPQINGPAELIYHFERAMQGPALDIMLRGFLIDQQGRHDMIRHYEMKRNRVEHVLARLGEVVGEEINYNSPVALRHLFYQTLGLPEQFRFDKGEKKVTTNRDALEKLESYFYAGPICRAILSARDIAKKLSVLHVAIDPDGRMRIGYNVAGTETGRWSSAENAFGTGTNGQNLTEELRFIFCADPGMRIGVIDLEQAESRAVGLIIWDLFGDPSYLDACESGDLHTTVAKLAWPELAWPSAMAAAREMAELPFYRHFSRRDTCKRMGHASNYYGQPPTISRNIKVEQQIVKQFQSRYFAAFPGIPRWHQHTARRLQLDKEITTALGRRRYFFGRPGDDATLREAIAFEPQSIVGDLLNTGLFRLWQKYPTINLLGQGHDAVIFQYPEDLHSQIPEVAKCLEIPISLRGRTMTIPGEIKTGWNWGKFIGPKELLKDPTKRPNPDGLKSWRGDERSSRTSTPNPNVLSRRLMG